MHSSSVQQTSLITQTDRVSTLNIVNRTNSTKIEHNTLIVDSILLTVVDHTVDVALELLDLFRGQERDEILGQLHQARFEVLPTDTAVLPLKQRQKLSLVGFTTFFRVTRGVEFEPIIDQRSLVFCVFTVQFIARVGD